MKDIIEYIHDNPMTNKGAIVDAFSSKYSIRSIRLFLKDNDWLTLEKGLNNASLFSISDDSYELAIDECEDGLEEQHLVDNAEARFVYGIQIAGESPIKIGITRDLRQRVTMLQTGHYKKYIVLFAGLTTDYYRVERDLHELFDSSRISGEWFSVTAAELSSAFIDLTG